MIDVSDMAVADQETLVKQFTPRWNHYLKDFVPTLPQAAFMTLEKFGVQEALLGGAAGGGKSWGLWALALQYADVPGYNCLILRRTFQELALPGALIDISQSWLRGYEGVQWDNMGHRWKFREGSSITFGYIECEQDCARYYSSAFSTICVDEATLIPWKYLQLVTNSRMRRAMSSALPLRIRYATNPGGVSHDEFRSYFVDPKTAQGVFLPARLEDNPYLDRESYKKSLSRLDPVSRERLLHGNWDARPAGMYFKVERIKIIDVAPDPTTYKGVRAWDMAGSVPRAGSNPDFTAGVLMSQTEDGRTIIHDVARFRLRAPEVEAKVRQIAELDGKALPVWLEIEPGSAGLAVCDNFVRKVLMGWEVQGFKTTGEKAVRAGPFASQVEAGTVYLVRGAWNKAYLEELEMFPEGEKKDQVDASSLAFNRLCEMDASGDCGFGIYYADKVGGKRL